MSDTSKIRRGILFGGVALLLAIFVVPLALNTVRTDTGPVGPTGTAIAWLVIALVALFGFYLGYSGWGKYKEM